MASGYCERCLSMTSSASGVEALFSEKGYQHYSMDGIYKSANKSQKEGCPCCALIWKRASPFGELDETLFLYATLEGFSSSLLGENSASGPGAYGRVLPFNRIIGRTADNADKLVLCAFTDEGV